MINYIFFKRLEYLQLVKFINDKRHALNENGQIRQLKRKSLLLVRILICDDLIQKHLKQN